MTQAQLAKRSGVSQSIISELENGVNDGSAHIVAIARALRRRPEWLESGKLPEMAGDAEHEWPFSLSPESYERLSPRAKAKIDEYMADLAQAEGVYERKSASSVTG